MNGLTSIDHGMIAFVREIQRKWRRFLLWANFSKRRKFAAALVRFKNEIEIWEKHNEGPPPIVWYAPDNDYIWVTREMRKNFQKRIKKSLKRGE